MKHFFASIVLATTLFLSSGCLLLVGGGAIAGTAYVMGKLESTLSSNITKSDAAVTKAMKKLEFLKISRNKTAYDAVHVYRNAKDEKIEITLKKVTENTTKVNIHVGLFGDEALSQNILDEIKSSI